MSDSTARLLEQFILRTGAIAESELRASYKASSLDFIQSILQSSLTVLSSNDVQARLVSELEHLSESTLRDFLAAMSRTLAARDAPASLRETVRRILGALAEAVALRVPEPITHALSRLDLVLTLGQTDDHQALVRGYPTLWGPETAHAGLAHSVN